MIPIEKNKLIVQETVALLQKRGVGLTPTADDARMVIASFATPIELREAGRIFNLLDQLGVEGTSLGSIQSGKDLTTVSVILS